MGTKHLDLDYKNVGIGNGLRIGLGLGASWSVGRCEGFKATHQRLASSNLPARPALRANIDLGRSATLKLITNHGQQLLSSPSHKFRES